MGITKWLVSPYLAGFGLGLAALGTCGCGASPTSLDALLGEVTNLVGNVSDSVTGANSQSSSGSSSQSSSNSSDNSATHDAGDDRGGSGSDDGAGHDANDDNGGSGSDDGAGHDANDDHGGSSGSDDNSGGNDNPAADQRLDASLRGSMSASGNAEYRVESGRRRFKVEVQYFPAGTYDVQLNGTTVATITVGALGTAEIELDSRMEAGHTPLPDNFPASVSAGDTVTVGTLVSGSF